MGRSPCCDKVGLKKGPWTPEEDQKLLAYIEEHGHGSWRALPSKAGLQRCGKSCRLRWTNYLRPDIKRGKFSLQEEQTIIQLHALLGNRWSAIATHLPKRTDNEIKNYWNTHLKKRLAKMGIDPVSHKPKTETLLSTEGGAAHQPNKHAANLSHMAQWESARLEAEARLARQSKLRSSCTNTSPNLFNTTSIFASPYSSCTPQNQPSIAAPFAPPRCLDVLKALNGGWIKQNEAGPHFDGDGDVDGSGGGGSVMGISRDYLESPTSTVSYSENVPQGSNVTTTIVESSNAFMELVGNSSGSEETEKDDWKSSLENSTSSGLNNDMTSMSAVDFIDDQYDNVPRDNFVERFTDLLLSGSGGRCFSEYNGDTDKGGSKGKASNCSNSDCCEDDKNYWDSILNLVNSSPSNLPVF